MHKRYIHFANCVGPFEAIDSIRLKELKANFPPRTSRRMTKLALLIGECVKGFPLAEADTLIYTTTFSESICLENYLASFPTPSPLGFQNSIHPSGLEQVLIAKSQPVSEFLSFAGRAHVMHSAITAACMSDNQNQWIIGAEEKGNWLTEKKYASEADFAFCIGLNQDPVGATGSISWDPDVSDFSDASHSLTTETFFSLVLNKKSWRSYCESLGEIVIEWLD